MLPSLARAFRQVVQALAAAFLVPSFSLTLSTADYNLTTNRKACLILAGIPKQGMER